MKDIVALLKENRELSGFRVAETQTESYELFFVHRKLETVRARNTKSVSVTVYADHDGKTGDSTFSVPESMTEDGVREKISQAVRRAGLVFNEPYSLPEGGKEQKELPSNLRDADMRELAAKISDAVFAADCVEGGSINATEIFLYRDVVRVINSRGVDKTQVKYRAMIEAIPTFTEGGESVELYEAYTFTQWDAEKITAEIADKMKEVSLRRKAVKPETPLKMDVVLRAKEISELLSGFTGDLTYASVYSQSNLHHKGDVLQNGDGDRMTLTMVGQILGSDNSSFFDADGVELKDTTLIRDGKVTGYYGSHRFASYLGEPETGDLRCRKLEPGTLTADELAKGAYLECVSLSGLQFDLYSDYIGGEIRLAYLHKNGKVEPVTGVTMSAKLSEVLATLRLSDTVTVDGSYEGPDKLLMRDISLL